MQKEVSKRVVGAVAQKADDAVGVSKGGRASKHWYVAIVNNNSERLCCEKLRARIAGHPDGPDTYEVYVASQKEMRVGRDGKRRQVDRILFRAIVFIRCTNELRLREIVRLPYIKRFMVNAAGRPGDGGIRPVAVIPDGQMRKLKRMVDDAETEITIDTVPLRLGQKVRVNGGKLLGLEGNVLDCPDGSTHLVIRIDMLGCAKVSIARDLLDAVS